MRKYLLINAYSAKNRGDAGIVTAMIHLIRKSDPQSQIYVMSSYWKENEQFYNDYNAHSVESVWNLDNGKTSIQRYLQGLMLVLKSLFSPKSIDFKMYHESDVIISVGGGYLYSSRKGPLGVGLLNALFHVWLAKKLNKKIIGFPQSVGPLGYYLDRQIVKSVLSKIDLFISREAITTNLLKSISVNNIKQIPDVGFTLPKYVSNVKLDKNEVKQKIGITLLDWRFAKKGSTDKDIDKYVNKVANVCKLLQSKHINCHFYIFPQVTVGEGDTDLVVSLELEKKLGKDCSTLIDLDSKESKPEQLVDLYSKMDIFIGSRMHSTIFALAGGTPTIALAYQHKTEGTFLAMGLEKYVFSVEDFLEEEVFKVIDEIIGERKYPIKEVQEKINELGNELLDELKRL